MNGAYQPSVWKKSLGFWAIFMVLYFAYKFFPNPVFAIFCDITESNFQHFKAAFFSWIFLNAFEFAFYRAKIGDRETWFYSRLGTAIFRPGSSSCSGTCAPLSTAKCPASRSKSSTPTS
jgi:hypothetical protein